MGIAEELKKQGYSLEYERDEHGDHAEVWINHKERMALKVVWMRIEGDETEARDAKKGPSRRDEGGSE